MPIASTQLPECFGDAHPDDLALDRATRAAKARLATERAELCIEWSQVGDFSQEELSERLHIAVHQGDALGAMGYAAMLHARGESIVPLTAPSDTTPLQRAARWLLSDDAGLSSEALCRHMLGFPCDNEDWGYPVPHDTGDLGRCLRLLKLIPEWAPRMPEMAQRGRHWAALVAEWDRLTELMVEETGPDFCQRRIPEAKASSQLMDALLAEADSVSTIAE